MDLATRKNNFIHELTTVDEQLLEKLETMLQLFKSKTDWSTELSQEEETEINEGIHQADNGELISHLDVIKKFDKWQ